MAKNTSKKTPASKNTTPKKIPTPKPRAAATKKPRAPKQKKAVLIPQLHVVPNSFQPADGCIDTNNPASTRTVDVKLPSYFGFDCTGDIFRKPANSWTKAEWDAATQDTQAVPPLFYEVTPAVKIVGYSLLAVVVAVAVWWGVQ